MSERKIRVLVAKPGLDGHDRGARVVASALRDAGCEVIYTGLRASVETIAAAAVQEDVDVIGLSILSGAHVSICRRLLAELKERGADIPVVVGGIIPDADRRKMLELGVRAVFGPESPLDALVEAVGALARGEGVEAPKSERPAMRLRGMAHVAVCVDDLDESARIFERLLGRKPAHREYVPEQKTEAIFFDLGDGTALELVAPREGNRGLEKFLGRHGPGLHHLALQVENLSEAVSELKRLGLELVDERPRPGARRHQVAFLHPRAAGGVLVELVEQERVAAREGTGKPVEGEGRGAGDEDLTAGADTGSR